MDSALLENDCRASYYVYVVGAATSLAAGTASAIVVIMKYKENEVAILSGTTKTPDMGNGLFERFIKRGAELELNLSFLVVKDAEDKVNAGLYTFGMFRAIRDEVLTSLFCNTFPKFAASVAGRMDSAHNGNKSDRASRTKTGTLGLPHMSGSRDMGLESARTSVADL
ncbi:hypothetical protein M427DRAFT_74605 [Gonapodya prolifera JEL478]|uniref:Uncharacterized protein n=1 Tax=Gonapodya prolifera (strain JEL478) TaxID=1344416 RepID=A0A139A097_GONPJ|nr:hypothetical protein M427DRAFT_74605 [Gonapodya prolifera JEL478]|eukprot:KXS10058.1 hypothetical protein M427DRAFT_74605 [Gonapodya prolifera JEL478]